MLGCLLLSFLEPYAEFLLLEQQAGVVANKIQKVLSMENHAF